MTKNQPFTASAYQIRLAWEENFGMQMPPNKTYKAAGDELCLALGHEEAKRRILAISNDPGSHK